MRQPACIRLLLSILVAAVAASVGSCGNGGRTSFTPDGAASHPQLQRDGIAAIQHILEAPAPRGVEPSLWRQLTAELARQVAYYGRDKAAAAPPAGERNAARDLHIIPGAATLQLAWTHHAVGDYDSNGEVNISDLTPIGMYFGASLATWGWDEARAADGDGNGEINISDITPIGQHYLVRTSAYKVYASASLDDYPDAADSPNGPGARLVGSIDLAEFTAVPGGRQLLYAVSAPVAGEFYWVRPSDGTSDGAASNYVAEQWRGDWWMEGREPQHRGCSPFFGPRDDNLAWTFTAGDRNVGAPVVRGDGVVYFGSEDSQLYAVTPDGEQLWLYTTEGAIRATPAIGTDGTVYIGSTDHYLYAINPDSSLGWRVDLGSDVRSPAIDSDGRIIVGTFAGDVVAVNPAGSIDWTFPTGQNVVSSPAIGTDGMIYAANVSGYLYAIRPDGSENWHFTAPGDIDGSPTIGEDGTVYFGSGDGHVYAVASNGTERWRYSTGDRITCGIALGVDGAIFTGGDSGYIYALESGGSLRWSYDTRSSIWATPLIAADGIVYAGTSTGVIDAINPDGNLHWRYETHASIGSGLALGCTGVLYACNAAGDLLAFSNGSGATPVDVSAVLPVDGRSGTSITMAAAVSGTPPFAYDWDFGGGATPGTSTEPTPTITLGAPGTYVASVSVASTFGPPTSLNFILYSYPAEPSPDGWVHTLGGNADDAFSAMAMLDDGSIYAAGGTGSHVPGSYSALIAQYSASGALQHTFVYTAGAWANSWISDMALGPAGSLYCVGDVQNEAGDDDILLLKFGSNRELLWQQAWNGGSYDYGEALMVDESGGVTLAGSTFNDLDNDSDLVLLRWDSSGTFNDGWIYDGSADENVCGIASDGASTYIGGFVEGIGEGSRDMLLCKLDADSTVGWAETFGSAAYEAIYAMQSDTSGNIYATGAGGLVCRFSPAGALDWARMWNGERLQTYDELILNATDLIVAGRDYTLDSNDNIIVLFGETTGAWNSTRLWEAAFRDDYPAACAVSPGGSLILVGAAAHPYGGWQDLLISTEEFAGVIHSITLTRSAVANLPVDLSGTTADLTLVQDAEGAEEDAVIFSWNFGD